MLFPLLFAWRDSTSRFGRGLLSSLAIGVGTGLLVVLLGLADRLSAAEVAAARQQHGPHDLSVKLAGAGQINLEPMAGLRQVTGAAGVLSVRTGERMTAGGARLVVTGIDFANTFAGELFPLLEGSPPQAERQVAVEEWVARGAGFEVGTVTELAGLGQVKVVGILANRPGSIATGRGFVITDLATARALDTGRRYLSEVLIKVDDGTDPRSALAALRALVGDAGQVAVNDQMVAAREKAASISRVLSVAGLAALLAAAFTVLNAMTMSLAVRTRELAIVRAVGASRSVLFGVVCWEALLVGAVSVIIALATVFGGSAFVHAAISPQRLLLVALTAVGTALVAGLIPALRAARAEPLKLISATRLAVLTVGPGRFRALLGAGGIALGLAGIIGFALSGGDGPGALISGLSGSVLFAVGLVLLTPWTLDLFVRILRPAVSSGVGIRGEIALLSLTRDRLRNAAAVSAILIATMTLVAFFAVADTRFAHVQESIRYRVPTDVVVRLPHRGAEPGAPPPAFHRDLVSAITALPQVGRVAVAGLAPAGVAGVGGQAGAPTGSELAALVGVNRSYLNLVSWRFMQGSADVAVFSLLRGDPVAVLSVWAAEELGVGVGDSIRVRSMGLLDVRLRVVGVVEGDPGLGNMPVYIPAALLPFADRAQMLMVERAPAVSSADLTAALQPLLDRVPRALVTDLTSELEQAHRQKRQIVAYLIMILVAVLGVASSGIITTIVMNVTERKLELGVMRALGASRALVSGTVTLEAAFLMLSGGVGGAVGGLIMGWTATAALALGSHSTLGFRPPVGETLMWLTGLSLVGLICGWFPARLVTVQGPAEVLRQ